MSSQIETTQHMLDLSNKGNNQIHTKWMNLPNCFNKKIIWNPDSHQQHSTQSPIQYSLGKIQKNWQQSKMWHML